jgi:hypothetical protein
MKALDEISKYPARIAVSSERPDQFFELLRDYVAVHAPATVQQTEVVAAIGEDISVIPCDSKSIARLSKNEVVTPVYLVGGHGPFAVPTGLVFVRLAANEDIRRHEEQFKSAGYRLFRALDYAPNSGWLESSSGSIAAALSGLEKLRAIPDVENFEPQMLMASHRR